MPNANCVYSSESVSCPVQFNEALALRFDVFCAEQNVPRALERDAEDALAFHVLVRNGEGLAVGTGRALRMRGDATQVSLRAAAMPGDVARIGRMAVRSEMRGCGVGRLVLKALEDAARDAGLARVVLHAQCQARPFYDRLGYVEQGARFTEAGIDHVTMTRRL